MKKLNHLDKYRISLAGHLGDETCGMFHIPYRNYTFRVIASDGMEWEHVSISLPNRCPNWEEMCYFKDLFFEEDECVIQYHPPKEDYINLHPYCLHLWRPQAKEIPRPPNFLVGF